MSSRSWATTTPSATAPGPVSRAADALQRRDHAARAAHDADAIDEADVDAEFEARTAHDRMHVARAQARLQAVPHAALERAVMDADLFVAARPRGRVLAGDDGIVFLARSQRHLVRDALGLAAHVDEDELGTHVAAQVNAAFGDSRERRDGAGERRVDAQPDRTQAAFVDDGARPIDAG